MMPVLNSFFHGYSEDRLWWRPLLAYAAMKGHGFLSVVTFNNAAMPMASEAQGQRDDWQDYDFEGFLNDGLTVVRLSDPTFAMQRQLPTLPVSSSFALREMF